MPRSLHSGILTIVSGLVLASPAHAARLLHVNIERNGKLIQKSYYQDDGRAERAELCRMLGQKPIDIGDSAGVTASADDPLSALLEGSITIRVRHVDTELFTATVENLRLIRSSTENVRWYLPPEEVARVAQTAGIKLDPQSTVHWISLIVFVAIAVILGVVLSRFRTPAADD